MKNFGARFLYWENYNNLTAAPANAVLFRTMDAILSTLLWTGM